MGIGDWGLGIGDWGLGELVADGLYHKGEQDDHPQPVGTAKAGGVEEGKRGKEGASEGDQCGEGELPLTACGIINQSAPLFGVAQ